MSAKEELEVKEFSLPEAMPLGYSFRVFTEYVIDRVPEFQSVSGARKGGKLVDAVEAAEKEPEHIVRWPTALWKLVCVLLNSEQFQLPKNFLVINGVASDQLVPLRKYLPFVDAILTAEDPKPVTAEPATDAPAEASTTN